MDDFLTEIPMGFSMAIAKNPDALREFSLLPEDRKKEIIEGTRDVNSQQEMSKYVQSLVNDNFNR